MRYVLIGLLTLLGAACTMNPAPVPALHDFGLPGAAPGLNEDIKPDIAVDAPTWLWDTRIHYRLLYATPSRIRTYMLDRWIASPPELFQQQLLVSSKTRNYPLVIRLLNFEQQFASPEHATVVLRFVAHVYSADHKRLLASKEFALQQATQTADAAGAVEGFTSLAQQAVDTIGAWLAALPHE